MNAEKEFEGKVAEHFKQLTPSLDAELFRMFHQAYADEVKFLLIEYDSPRFAINFAVSIWPMDSKGEPFGDGHHFLKDRATAVPAEVYEDEKYEEIEPWDTASELLENWFIDRVSQLDLETIKIKAFIGQHDSHFKKDLFTGKTTNWDKIMKQLSGV